MSVELWFGGGSLIIRSLEDAYYSRTSISNVPRRKRPGLLIETFGVRRVLSEMNAFKCHYGDLCTPLDIAAKLFHADVRDPGFQKGFRNPFMLYC